MINPDLLSLLCCPESRQELKLAEAALVERLNRQIAAGALKNRAGLPVVEPIDGGLVRADGCYLYPIRRNIPVLLVEEGIGLTPASEACSA